MLKDCHWADVSGVKHGISKFQLFKGLLGKLIYEVPGDILMNVDSLYRIPALARVVEAAFDQSLECEVHVTIRGHICGILPTKVQLHIDEIILSYFHIDVVSTL
jgi:hypothetical protein